MTKLTAKQEAFVREYVVDKNATQAAIRAGYSENTAHAIGQENLRKPIIKEAVDELLNEHAERCAVTVDSLTDEMNECIAMAKSQGDTSTLRAAIMSKAKLHGKDVAKVEHSGDDGGPILLWGNKPEE